MTGGEVAAPGRRREGEKTPPPDDVLVPARLGAEPASILPDVVREAILGWARLEARVAVESALAPLRRQLALLRESLRVRGHRENGGRARP